MGRLLCLTRLRPTGSQWHFGLWSGEKLLGQDVGNRWWRNQKRGGWGWGMHLHFEGRVLQPSYLHGPLISRAIPVLINTSKYASQHRAGDTCVDI